MLAAPGGDVPRRRGAHDRFDRDLAGWRLVGVDAYLLGHAEHDDWFRHAVTTDGPVLVFVHQPVRGDRDDEWVMSDAARPRSTRAVAGADVRVVASGHRHCWRRDGPRVWAPSLTLIGEAHDRRAMTRPAGSSSTASAPTAATTSPSCASDAPAWLRRHVDGQHDDQHDAR